MRVFQYNIKMAGDKTLMEQLDDRRGVVQDAEHLRQYTQTLYRTGVLSETAAKYTLNKIRVKLIDSLRDDTNNFLKVCDCFKKIP